MNSDPTLGAPVSRRRVPSVHETRIAGETPVFPGALLKSRQLEPEWLDFLPNSDLRAQRSRSDLRRLNRLMGHARIARAILRPLKTEARPLRLTEIGAGDGSFLLSVAGGLGRKWGGTRAILVDRLTLLTDEMSRAFCNLGWAVQARTCDVLDWCDEPDRHSSPVTLANLFLHHLDSESLRRLLAVLAGRSSCFIAIEPRRSLLSLCFSKLVGLIGCNEVTRHDAPASVRAGFRQNELTRLWPRSSEWKMREGRVGAFSHLFVARRLPD